MKKIVKFILIHSALIICEFFLLGAIVRRASGRKDTRASGESEDRFWQNIISYDHRKGGKKD